MGQAIVKCARDRDLYLIWSSVVDAPIFVGDRAALHEHLLLGYEPHSTPLGNSPVARIHRADRTGTSMIYPPKYGWDDTELRVMEGAPDRPDGPAGDWFIPRDRLVEYAEALMRDDDGAANALLVWRLWDGPVRRRAIRLTPYGR